MTGKPETKVMIEYLFGEDGDTGQLWIDIRVNREPYGQIGPFETDGERQRAYDDILSITRSVGAMDVGRA
jgi:hypothetical protein